MGNGIRKLIGAVKMEGYDSQTFLEIPKLEIPKGKNLHGVKIESGYDSRDRYIQDSRMDMLDEKVRDLIRDLESRGNN